MMRNKVLFLMSFSFEKISTASLKVAPFGMPTSIFLLPTGSGRRSCNATYSTQEMVIKENAKMTLLFMILG
jgi:hypothetical protein